MTRIIQLIDNLDFARDRTETKADHTIRIAWQLDDGEVVQAELDLTRAHTAEYLESLHLLAEHANPGQGGPALRAIRPASSKASPVRDQGLAASKRYRLEQRKYADRYGILRLDGGDQPAYLTPSGGAYWPEWLDTSYQHFIATGRVIVPVTRPEFEALDGNRSWKSYLFGWTPQRDPRHVIESGGAAVRSLGGAGDAPA